MYGRVVHISMLIDGKLIEIGIHITCMPDTPKSELIRRAGNIFRQAALDATFTVGD